MWFTDMVDEKCICWVCISLFRAFSSAHRRPWDGDNFPRERFSAHSFSWSSSSCSPAIFVPRDFLINISFNSCTCGKKHKRRTKENWAFVTSSIPDNSDDGFSRYVGPWSWHLFLRPPCASSFLSLHSTPVPINPWFFLYSRLCWFVLFCCPWVVLSTGYISLWTVGVSAFWFFFSLSLSLLVQVVSFPR